MPVNESGFGSGNSKKQNRKATPTESRFEIEQVQNKLNQDQQELALGLQESTKQIKEGLLRLKANRDMTVENIAQATHMIVDPNLLMADVMIRVSELQNTQNFQSDVSNFFQEFDLEEFTPPSLKMIRQNSGLLKSAEEPIQADIEIFPG